MRNTGRRALHRLPGLPRTAGRHRRVQRQVHGQQMSCCAAAASATPPRPCPQHLLCLLSRRTPAGCSVDSLWQRIFDEQLGSRSPSRASPDRTRTSRRPCSLACPASRAPFRPDSCTTRMAQACSTRSACPSTTSRAPRRRSSGATPRISPAVPARRRSRRIPAAARSSPAARCTLKRPALYTPIDISRLHLDQTASRLRRALRRCASSLSAATTWR